MSKIHPSPPAARPSANGTREPASMEDSGSLLELWDDDEALRREMTRLLEENRQLLATRGDQTPRSKSSAPDTCELDLLRGENAELHARLAEYEQLLLEQPTDGGEEAWRSRQAEYEGLLEEKSEVIRKLHQEVQEARKALDEANKADDPETMGEIDLSAPAAADLRRIKAQLEQERQRLEDDEQALMQQMRQMELQMSKERADLGRQRAELVRLKQDLEHEAETASRDSGLRERLASLQRPNQEGQGEVAKPAKERGIFKRLFGGS